MKTHQGKIPFYKEMMRTLNKFKQGSSRNSLPIYIGVDHKEFTKLLEINVITEAYRLKNKNNTDNTSVTHETLITPKEYETKVNKEIYEKILIIGNYDRSNE